MSVEAIVGWAMVALVVLVFAAALVRLVSVALAVKALVSRVTKLPDQFAFDSAKFEAVAARLTPLAARTTPLVARANVALRRIEAVIAVWRRIGGQVAFTLHAAGAVVRELR